VKEPSRRIELLKLLRDQSVQVPLEAALQEGMADSLAFTEAFLSDHEKSPPGDPYYLEGEMTRTAYIGPDWQTARPARPRSLDESIFVKGMQALILERTMRVASSWESASRNGQDFYLDFRSPLAPDKFVDGQVRDICHSVQEVARNNMDARLYWLWAQGMIQEVSTGKAVESIADIAGATQEDVQDCFVYRWKGRLWIASLRNWRGAGERIRKSESFAKGLFVGAPDSERSDVSRQAVNELKPRGE
jgi:hypothetical protein